MQANDAFCTLLTNVGGASRGGLPLSADFFAYLSPEDCHALAARIHDAARTLSLDVGAALANGAVNVEARAVSSSPADGGLHSFSNAAPVLGTKRVRATSHGSSHRLGASLHAAPTARFTTRFSLCCAEHAAHVVVTQSPVNRRIIALLYLQQPVHHSAASLPHLPFPSANTYNGGVTTPAPLLDARASVGATAQQDGTVWLPTDLLGGASHSATPVACRTAGN
ncbi:MAG: hypothetical protein EOO41_02170, partial [Methanobacteriota archaeon]